MQGLTGRSEPQRDSHPNPEHVNDNSCHNNNNDGYQDKNNDDDDHVTGHTSKNNITQCNEQDQSIATYAADTRDRDAPIVLVVPRVRLVAMTGTRQQVQHLHEIATKESRPAVQKTILKIKRSGTILRQN